MGAGDYLEGLLLFSLLLAGAVAAATRIVSAYVPRLAGAARIAAVGLLATALVLAIHLIPAAIGILGRLPVAVLSLLALGLAWRLPRAERPGAAGGEPTLPRLGIAWVGVAALALFALAAAIDLGATPLTNIDTLSFHLPGVARWIQSQSIWQIDQFLPGQAQGYYPGNGNVVELAAVLPWHSDFLIRFANLPFLALAGVATYAAARELGARPSGAGAAACAALSVPAVTTYVVDSPTPDQVMYAGFATGVLFLLRHARTGLRAELALAGVGLGIAFGSRWYGVSSVAVVTAVWLGTRLASRPARRGLGGDAALLCATVALAGGIWLVRNLVESGNPVFPVEVRVLGETLFAAPRDVVRELAGWRIADYLGDPSVLGDYIVPAWRSELTFTAPLLLAGALAAGAVAARDRLAAGRARVVALAVATAGAAAAYAITPYTALGLEGAPIATGSNARYAVPALLLAAPAAAWLVERAGRARPFLDAVLVIAALDAIRRGVGSPAGDVAVAVGLLAVAVATGLGARARKRHPSRRDRRRAALVTIVAALLAAAGLYEIQRRALDDRYADAPPAVAAALGRAEPGSRIGVAGAWPVTTLSPILPLFGDRLDNRVEYVGRLDEDMLVPYGDGAGFSQALERGDYDLVLVGDEDPLGFPGGEPLKWAPQAGYRRVAADDHFTLFAR